MEPLGTTGDAVRGSIRQSSARRVIAAGRRGVKRIAAHVLPESVVVWRGPERAGAPHHPGRVALTFDDGPTDLTPRYLETLARYGARATFFVIGELGEQRPDLLSEIAAAGHELAGHGYTHRPFTTLSNAELSSELRRTSALLPRTSEKPFVRPPYGAVSPRSLLACARAGFTTVLWSYDSGDSRTKSASDVSAAFRDERVSEPGTIALLHEGYGWTMEALPTIVDNLRKAGHDLVTVGDLLHG